MRLTRIHVPAALQVDAEVMLKPSAANHLVRVLRLNIGAALLVFDGQGHQHHAQISSINGSKVSVRVGAALPSNTESPVHITLVQGISRGERMDWTLQKATELGVSAIVPVLTARSVVRLDEQQAQKKLEHWQNIVIGACEQSGRSVVPSVHAPVTLSSYLATQRNDVLRLILDPAASASLASVANNASNNIELLIGPEGGFDDEEVLLAEQAGFTPVGLGPRILRTETAAVVALTVLQALGGDLQ